MAEALLGRDVAAGFLSGHFPKHKGVQVGRTSIDFLAYGDTGQFIKVVRYVPAKYRGDSATLDTIIAPERRLRYHDRHPNSGLGWNPYNSTQNPSVLEMAGIAVATSLEIPENPLTSEINTLVFGALQRAYSETENGIAVLNALSVSLGKH